MRLSNGRTIRQFESGPTMTAKQMVAGVHEIAGDWEYDVVSVGYPGVVIHGKIIDGTP
jgi:polyphosphate glucokinase